MKNKMLIDLDVYREAEFYDQEFQDRDQEIPFFLKWARRAPGAILEVACGTGRITLPIAQEGMDISGSDLMPDMLRLARQKSDQLGVQVEWLEQDCREIVAARPYHLIYSATNAMQHLLDRESALTFLRSARKALHPDGHLILDVFNPNPKKLSRKPDQRYVHKHIQLPDGKFILVEAISQYHSVEQILEFQLFYTQDHQEICRKRVRMRCFYPEELLLLCQITGWGVIQRFGYYDESPFENHSPKQILICKPTPQK